VIDLGSVKEGLHQTIDSALVAAGLERATDAGLDLALTGSTRDLDENRLAEQLDDAHDLFARRQCKGAVAAAETAIAIAAARQAARLGGSGPALVDALTMALLCADAEGDLDTATFRAAGLHALGALDAPRGPVVHGVAQWGAVDASIVARYPEVDALAGGEPIEVELRAEVPGAELWIDFAPAGTSPRRVALTAGRHVIAAASGSRRGTVTGTVVASQPVIALPMPDQAGPYGEVARRIESWHHALPAPAELAWVMSQLHVRIVLIRHGGLIEAWGRAGVAEPPHRLGGDDGIGGDDDVPRLIGLVAERVRSWTDRAPDPDRPLLTETRAPRPARGDRDEPTKWWVYVAVAGAVLAGTLVIYAHDSATDTQRVTLHYP
jgi:hypothetical protein